MTAYLADLSRRAIAALEARAPWLARRLKEPSTWAGLAVVAIDLGFPGAAHWLSAISKDLPILLAIAGAGAAAATTSQHPPAPQP